MRKGKTMREKMVEEAKEMLKLRRVVYPGAEEYFAKSKVEKEKQGILRRKQYERFMRALSRLGCHDYRKVNKNKVTQKTVLEEIMKDEKDDDFAEEEWNMRRVFTHLNQFLKGYCPLNAIGPEFRQQMDSIINGELGKGDVLSHALTHEAIFDRFDPKFKTLSYFHAIPSYMIRAQETELMRRRLCKPALRPCSSTGDPMDMDSVDDIIPLESPYRREKRLELEKEIRSCNHEFTIFFKALSRLGGEDNIDNINPQDMYNLITQELDTSDDDHINKPHWTVAYLESMLSFHKAGGHPLWTIDHRNRMLKAIHQLCGHDFDHSSLQHVTPEAVLRLMDAHATVDSPPMCLSGVKKYLDDLRLALEKNPSHPLRYPKTPAPQSYLLPYRFTPQQILKLAGENPSD